MRRIQLLHKDQGFVMPSIIITTLFITTMAIIVTELAVSNFRIAIEDRARLNAQMATDAGLDYAVAALNNDNDWTDTSGEKDLLVTASTRVTYEVSAADGADANEKIITSTGRSYEPADAISPKHERTFVATLRGVDNSGTFSIVTGVGGLFLSNSAAIVGGDVFVNGEISLTNSAQIGLTTNSVTVEVAHQNCPKPANASYPTMCGPTDGQPITLANSAKIYGTVRANNQVTTTGISSPGLVATSGVAARPLPTYDRDAHKAAANASGNALTGAQASCTSNGGSVLWPANVKITGNVTISRTCNVTLLGDAWITGTVTMTNSGRITVSNALATEPDVMVDGTLFSMRNSSSLVSNASGKGMYIRTYRSSATCSPDCANVTGTDLYNSRTVTTIDLDNSASAPKSVLFARWSRVTINNSGQIGALVGQTVELRNSSAVTFGTSVPTPGANAYTYVVDQYRRDE